MIILFILLKKNMWVSACSEIRNNDAALLLRLILIMSSKNRSRVYDDDDENSSEEEVLRSDAKQCDTKTDGLIPDNQSGTSKKMSVADRHQNLMNRTQDSLKQKEKFPPSTMSTSKLLLVDEFLKETQPTGVLPMSFSIEKRTSREKIKSEDFNGLTKKKRNAALQSTSVMSMSCPFDKRKSYRKINVDDFKIEGGARKIERQVAAKHLMKKMTSMSISENGSTSMKERGAQFKNTASDSAEHTVKLSDGTIATLKFKRLMPSNQILLKIDAPMLTAGEMPLAVLNSERYMNSCATWLNRFIPASSNVSAEFMKILRDAQTHFGN
jgi:hypothetical protein